MAAVITDHMVTIVTYEVLELTLSCQEKLKRKGNFFKYCSTFSHEVKRRYIDQWRV